MKYEDLKALIEETVKTQIAPLEETHRKYAGLFDGSIQPPAPPDQKGEKLEPGIRMARFGKLMVLSKNDPEQALHLAAGSKDNSKKGMYPNDVELHNSLKALSASSPTDGGFLIEEQYANEIIPLLYSKAVVRKLGARPLPMENGNLNLPKMTNGATSYYVGENTDARTSQQKFGNLKLSGKKLVTLVPVSNDLIRSTSPLADAMIRDDMIMSMALKEDWTALYGAGSEYSPRGVVNTKGIKSDAYGQLPTNDNDFANMLGYLLTQNIPMVSPGWSFNGAMWSHFYNMTDGKGAYIHRAEMTQGLLFGIPFAISNQITLGTDAHTMTDVFLGDWSEFIIGEQMGVRLEASQEASYIDGTGKMVSAFSQDQTLLKVTNIHDFGARHPEAFFYRKQIYTQ